MNGKAIGVAAGLGLTLSFLTGIISKNAFLTVFRNALLFAFIFAVLAAGISFLFEKFLSDGTGQSFTLDLQPKSQKSRGNVDIVISDDNLEEEDDGPKFFVENNRQGLSQKNDDAEIQNLNSDVSAKTENNSSVNDISEQKNIDLQNDSSLTEPKELDSPSQLSELQGETKQFVPASVENVAGGQGEQAVSSVISQDVPVNAGDGSNKVNNFADGSNIESIDSLPDIGEFSEDKKNDSVGDIINDSDFATKGSSASSSTVLPNGTEASSANADVMAQAIRTLLKKDES